MLHISLRILTTGARQRFLGCSSYNAFCMYKNIWGNTARHAADVPQAMAELRVCPALRHGIVRLTRREHLF